MVINKLNSYLTGKSKKFPSDFNKILKEINFDLNNKDSNTELLWKAYNAKFVEAMNIVEVTAHVSSNLSGEESAELKTSLESALGMSTELNVNVDPSLIGGIKLRVGNKFMDASIQNQLDKMRQSLLEA